MLSALSLNDKQLQKLDQFIAQINNDTTLRHKIEKINLTLTNQQKLSNTRSSMSNELSPGSTSINSSVGDGVLSASPSQASWAAREGASMSSETSSVAATSVEQIDEQQATNGGGGGKSLVNYERVDMLLIDLRKYIAHSVYVWNTRMSEFFKKSKTEDVSLFFRVKVSF